MEDKHFKYFPAEIEKQQVYTQRFETDMKTVAMHPQIIYGRTDTMGIPWIQYGHNGKPNIVWSDYPFY